MRKAGVGLQCYKTKILLINPIHIIWQRLPTETPITSSFFFLKYMQPTVIFIP